MTEELPNFKAVTLDEAIEKGDTLIGNATVDDEPPMLSSWVTAENARRADAQIAYEAASFEVAGVTLSPGDCATLTIKGEWGKRHQRRFNCVIVCQQVSRPSYGRSDHAVSFRRYGGNRQNGYGHLETVFIRNVTNVEVVEMPVWVVNAEAQRKERGY